jgi:exodeoxyribonuclease VII small subunit
MHAKQKSADEMSYEQAFAELEQMVAALEGGELPLEHALTLFERGQALAARCTALLEQAELRLKELVADGDGGYREEEFEATDA